MNLLMMALLISTNLYSSTTGQPYLDAKTYPTVVEVSENYNVDPDLIAAIVYTESSWNADATNKNSIGLMQIAPEWHQDRIKKLDVHNLLDSEDNIKVGVDFMAELLQKYPTEEALMYYNMGHKSIRLYEAGTISAYATKVMDTAEYFRSMKKLNMQENLQNNWTYVKNTEYWQRY